MTESRRLNRTRTLLGARVVKGGLSMLDCHVKDITDRGAKLIVDSVDILPEEFELDIPRKGRSYKAVVRWRDSGAAGVEFLEPQGEAVVGPDTRIKALEAENAALRRRIADMAKRLDAYGDTERSAI